MEFWDFPRLPAVAKWQEAAIAEFERQNPDVHVELTRLSWAKGGERLDIAAFAGRPPDLAGATLQMKYVDANLIAPIDEYLDEEIPDMPGTTWREDIHPEILKAVQWQGKTWAFPWYKEGFVIILNRDLFEERGVSLPKDGRWTWDEFIEIMKQMTFDRNGDGKADVYGIGFNTGREKWEAYSFLFGEGMKLLSSDGRSMEIDSEATRLGINRLLEMEFEDKFSLPGAGGIQDDTTWTAFSGSDRRLAATCQGLWAVKATTIQNDRLAQTLKDNPDIDNPPKPLNIAIALFPQMPGEPQVMASYGVGSYMVFRRDQHPERTRAAARLARFLTLQTGQEINAEAGLLPSRKSMIDVLAGQPMYKDIVPFLPDAISPPTHPAWKQLDQVISDQLQLALLRRETVDEAVDSMAKQGQWVLDNFWKTHDQVAAEENK